MSRKSDYHLTDFYIGLRLIGPRTDESTRLLCARFGEMGPECQEYIARQAVALANRLHGVSPVGALEILHAVGRTLVTKGAVKA